MKEHHARVLWCLGWRLSIGQTPISSHANPTAQITVFLDRSEVPMPPATMSNEIGPLRPLFNYNTRSYSPSTQAILLSFQEKEMHAEIIIVYSSTCLENANGP